MPIGNLTSQIFSNIYLNELDRFVVHALKPRDYLRYGDDFILFCKNKEQAEHFRSESSAFLKERLFLAVNVKNDFVVKARHGIHFLGVEIFPFGRKLKKRVWKKTLENLRPRNSSSYSGLVRQHSNRKRIKELDWRIFNILNELW